MALSGAGAVTRELATGERLVCRGAVPVTLLTKRGPSVEDRLIAPELCVRVFDKSAILVAFEARPFRSGGWLMTPHVSAPSWAEPQPARAKHDPGVCPMDSVVLTSS